MNKKSYFGKFGGQYVPETVMSALIELENEYNKLKEDKKFKEGELVFYSLQNIYYNSDYDDVVFPFNITWDLNTKKAIELLGEDYFKYSQIYF